MIQSSSLAPVIPYIGNGVGKPRPMPLKQSRREVLGTMIGAAAAPLTLARPTQPPGLANLAPEDHQFLEELEKGSFFFFWDQASPETGLVRDRCNTHKQDRSMVASIAATG